MLRKERRIPISQNMRKVGFQSAEDAIEFCSDWAS
jgi:hypothetical protein